MDFDTTADSLIKFFISTIHPLFMEGFRTVNSIKTTEKDREGRKELVSELDRKIQDAILGFLDGEVISEELNQAWPPASNEFWVLDPLDGTHMFLMGTMLCGTQLAYVQDGRVVFSFVFLPMEHLATGMGFYIAGEGKGAWHMGSGTRQRLAVSRAAKLSETMVFIEGPSHARKASRHVEKLLQAAGGDRHIGATCVAGTRLVIGNQFSASVGAFIGIGNKPFDHLPHVLLVQEADGKVTDLEGNPPTLQNCANLVFSNGILHDEILSVWS